MSWVAITRPVSDALEDCELTHLDRVPISVERARTQHAGYEALLARLGCRIERPAAAGAPDGVFVRHCRGARYALTAGRFVETR